MKGIYMKTNKVKPLKHGVETLKPGNDSSIINDIKVLKTALQCDPNNSKNSNSSSKIYLVVSMDKEGEFARSVYHRLIAHPNKNRTVIMLSFELFKNLHQYDIKVSREINAYLVAHGYVARIGEWNGSELAAQLTPTLIGLPQIKEIKLTSCYSANFVDLEAISDQQTKASIKNHGYDSSLLKEMSHALNSCELGFIKVSGYKGQQYEDSSSEEAGKYAKVKHSFVKLGDDTVYRASKARFTFQYDKLITCPQESVINAPLTGELSVDDDSANQNTTFVLTSHKLQSK